MHLLLESLGPQDGEQNLLGGVLAGLDHADYLAVQAPRPILVMANTRDYFSIQGARETCTEVARAYAALGAPSAFRKEEDDAPHGFTPVSRSFIYAFFQQSLNLPGDPREEPVEPLRAGRPDRHTEWPAGHFPGRRNHLQPQPSGGGRAG